MAEQRKEGIAMSKPTSMGREERGSAVMLALAMFYLGFLNVPRVEGTSRCRLQAGDYSKTIKMVYLK